MQKPPRGSDDPLLTPWVVTRYMIIGTYVGFATIGIFIYWYLFYHHADGHSLITWDQLTHWNHCVNWTENIPNSYGGIEIKTWCDYFTVGKRKPVTLSLSVLVIIEMFNACNAISDESSLLSMPPTRNKWLLLAIFSSVTLHCMIIYIPFFNDIFGIMRLDLNEWILVIVFSAPVCLIDEIIKLYVRMTLPKKSRRKVD
jgi:Ca2+-transporting ATPase